MSLAIIPARAGSKRIIGKNKRSFLGKPLISWTIEAALEAKEIKSVIVSSDDEEVLALAPHYPGVIFEERASHLATDISPAADVIIDILKRYGGEHDVFLYLQPTSPLRSGQDIASALTYFKNEKCKQLVGVRKCLEVPSHIMQIERGFLKPLFKDSDVTRSQDWGELLVLNGSIYISEIDYFNKSKSFLGDQTRPFKMSLDSSVDIDTEEDWVAAESIGRKIFGL